MRTHNGGPAFPRSPADVEGWRDGAIGMTLRDYFAAKAMVGITQALAQGVRPHDVPKLAADAYFLADAMLKARDA
jgi:hypothetical protein